MICDARHNCDCWTIGLNDKKGGDINEWPADLRVREFPKLTSPCNIG